MEDQQEPELKPDGLSLGDVHVTAEGLESPSGKANSPLAANEPKSPTGGRRKQRSLRRVSTTFAQDEQHAGDSGSPSSLASEPKSPTGGRRKQRSFRRLSVSVTMSLAQDEHDEGDSGSPTSLTSPKAVSPRPMELFEAEAILAGPQTQHEEDQQKGEDASIRRLRDHLREKYGSNEKVWEALDVKGQGSLSLRGLRDALEAESINVENVVRGRHDLRGLFRVLDYSQAGRLTMHQLMQAHPRIERRRLAAAVKFAGPDFDDPPVDVQPLLEPGSDLAQSAEWMQKLAILMQDQSDEKKDLLLHHCCIGVPGAQLLAAQLRATKIPGLREINLRANYIGDTGVRHLAQALECANHCIEKIVLPWNGLSDKGATRVARMITQLTTLKEVDISFNRISSAGASWLSEALSIRPALRNLSMQGNRISEAWAERLRESGGARCAVDVEGIDVPEPETTAPPKPKRDEAQNEEQTGTSQRKSVASKPRVSRKSAVKARGSALPELSESVGPDSEQPSPHRVSPIRKNFKMSPMWSCDPAYPLPCLKTGREWMGEGARITCTKFGKVSGPRPLTRQIMSRSGREELIVRRKDAFFPGLARKPVTPMTKTSSLPKPMTPLTLPTLAPHQEVSEWPGHESSLATRRMQSKTENRSGLF